MKILVIGSGASGVHFARSALERGHAVELVDLGFAPEPAVASEASFPELFGVLPDPIGYFLGRDGGHVVYPSPSPKFYGFPPTKDYVFRQPAGVADRRDRFDPLISYARGGLAEAWTGGSYEYSDADLAHFPFDPADLRRGYATVADRIGITGTRDDLARFSPVTAEYLSPHPLDPHSSRLVDRYARHRGRLNRAGFFLGRSRVAMLTAPRGGRGECTGLGRCLWGCPRQSLYAPSVTLAECRAQPGFHYRDGILARRFASDADGIIRGLIADRVDGGPAVTISADLYVLAAGTLGSARIYLESVTARTGSAPRLGGLLDNRMAMVPFLSLAMIGKEVALASYQFHLLAFGLAAGSEDGHAHGQITTLKAASLHPIVQNFPLDLRTSLALFRRIRAGLAVATLWLPDRRDDGNAVTLVPRPDGGFDLGMSYRESEWQRTDLAEAIGRLRSALGRLGAVVPRGMTKVLPHGASVHYGGTLPMTGSGGAHTLTPEGRSRLFGNLLVADGSGFPFLPAKNHTFTLMANAVRIAEANLP